MNKILIAVDDTKSSKAVVTTYINSTWQPDSIILLNVERLEGRSAMIDMLGEAELSTLKESIIETEYKEALDRKAEKILTYYKNEFESEGSCTITPMIRAGRPAEEILKVADEENVDLILLGNDKLKGFNGLLSGSVAANVQKNANVPVVVAKRPVMCEEPYSWKDAYEAVTITTLIVICLFLFGVML